MKLLHLRSWYQKILWTTEKVDQTKLGDDSVNELIVAALMQPNLCLPL